MAGSGTPAGMNHTWSVLVQPPGGAGCNVSITDPASYTTQVCFPAGCTGQATLRLTVTNPPCPAATDDVILTVVPRSTVNAGPDQSKCEAEKGDTCFTMAGSGTPPAAGHTWSVVTQPPGGAGCNVQIADASSYTTQVCFPAGCIGSATLRLTVNGTPPCPNVTDDVVLTVAERPTCDIDDVQTMLAGKKLTGSILTGTGPFGCTAQVTGTGWSIVGCTVDNAGAGPGFVVDFDVMQPATKTPIFEVTVYPLGDTECSSTCDQQLTIVVNCEVQAPSSQSVCQGASASQFCVSPSGISPFSFAWYANADPARNALSGCPDPAPAAAFTTQCFTPSTATVGTFSFFAVVTDALGFCSPTPCSVSIEVKPNPPCTITGPNTIACDAPRTVQYCGPAGMTTYAWTISGNGTITNPAAPPFNTECITVTAGTSGSFTVNLATTLNGCPSPDSSDCHKTVTIEECLGEACSPGFWKQTQHFPAWCDAGYQPVDNFCGAGAATLFKDAFNITNFSAAGIPTAWKPPAVNTKTLFQAVAISPPGGSFNQTLFQGTAALLNAAAIPGFGHSVTDVQTIMQEAFAGTRSFSSAATTFASWTNTAEAQGGCPCNTTGCDVGDAAPASNAGAVQDQSGTGQAPILGSRGTCGVFGAASILPFLGLGLLGLGLARRGRAVRRD
jgi:hypothetical protein